MTLLATRQSRVKGMLRLAVCVSCSESFERAQYGPTPKWCADCRALKEKARWDRGNLASKRSRHFETRLKWYECASCLRSVAKDASTCRSRKVALCATCEGAWAWCSDCQALKPRVEFSNNSESANGLAGYCKSCFYAKNAGYSSKQRAKNPDYYRDRNLWSSHRLRPADWQAMFEAQDGRCAICRRTEAESGRLHVDHCHRAGTVRALLCSGCNKGIGQFLEDPVALRAAADYVERHSTP